MPVKYTCDKCEKELNNAKCVEFGHYSLTKIFCDDCWHKAYQILQEWINKKDSANG